jgi:transcriptional regulator with GAF, ATPase, and Fis domain
MTGRTAAQAFADATSALTHDHDVTDVLARLIRDCAEVLSAKAIGVLVLNAHADLELLSATSHRVAELELFQMQQDNGPCIEAIRRSAVVSVIGEQAIKDRWPDVGLAIADAGYDAVHAYPLQWHGHTLGAMNVFHAKPSAAPPEQEQLGQAFADIATIVIVQSTDLTLPQVTDRVQQALQARTLIEQAKGVLAYQHNLDMATAYDLLLTVTGSEAALTATAAGVIDHARQQQTDS